MVARSVDLRLRRDEVRREHEANTVQANAQASCHHDRRTFLLARVRQCVSSNIAARSVHGGVDPTWEGCVMSKFGRRNNGSPVFAGVEFSRRP